MATHFWPFISVAASQGRIIDLNVDQTHVFTRLHKCDQIINIFVLY